MKTNTSSADAPIRTVASRQFTELAHHATNSTADAAVAFGFLGTIFDSVGVLALHDTGSAFDLAKAGAYWAESMESQMVRFQDSIDEAEKAAS